MNKIRNYVNYLWLLLAFSIPLYKPITIYLMILIGLSLLITGKYQNTTKRKNLLKLALTLLWILPMFQLVSIGDLNEEWHHLEIKLSLLFFPFFLLISDFDQKKYLPNIFKMFILGCVMASFLCLTNSAFSFISSDTTSSFFYKELSIFHHPSYFALFLTFSTSILLHHLVYGVKGINLNRQQSIFFILVFALIIILLTSRSAWIIFSLLVVTFLAIAFYKKRLTNRQFSSICFAIVIVLGTAYSQEKIRWRINEVFKYTLHASSQSNYPSSTGTRSKAWEASFNSIAHNPWLGYGLGNGNKKLKAYYNEKGYQHLYKRNTNAHNQFLQTALDHGVLGLLCLITLTIVVGIISLKNQKLMPIFLFIISLNFLTESMLETQSGIVFFSFFNTLFYFKLIDN